MDRIWIELKENWATRRFPIPQFYVNYCIELIYLYLHEANYILFIALLWVVYKLQLIILVIGNLRSNIQTLLIYPFMQPPSPPSIPIPLRPFLLFLLLLHVVYILQCCIYTAMLYIYCNVRLQAVLELQSLSLDSLRRTVLTSLIQENRVWA